MGMFFDLVNEDPHFFTMLSILVGAFLFGLFYFYQADKEYERKSAIEWEELANTFTDLTRVADVPTILRTEHATKPE